MVADERKEAGRFWSRRDPSVGNARHAGRDRSPQDVAEEMAALVGRHGGGLREVPIREDEAQW